MRSEGDLKDDIEKLLSAETGAAVTVRDVALLGGGACQDNYRVDLTFASGELEGDRRMALRSDAKRSLPASIDRRAEFEVVRAAWGRGVRTPRPRWLSRDLVRDGAWSYFLDWVEGDAIGRKVLRDPRLAGARAGLAAELGADLAKIHEVTPESAPAAALVLPPPEGGDAVGAALAFMRDMMDRMRAPSLALELVMRWLSSHRPAARPLALVHGDFRTGNFMVRPDGLAGILDWEFAHWGAPEDDLAWISMRNWRFGQDKLPVGGFAQRAELYDAYEAASGRPVDRRAVHFWEVVGNVRWAAGCALQGERFLSGEEDDIELIAIPRHAAEMELEALRLIEKGA